MMDVSEPIVVARAWTESEASIIKSLLESYSIPCHFSSELPHRLYHVSAEGLGPIKIFVTAALAEDARQVLDEHRRNQSNLHLVED